jgi:hypothetical protein
MTDIERPSDTTSVVISRRSRLSRSYRVTDLELTPDAAKARFRRTLTQVLIVQVVALALLGLLQVHYQI